MTKVLNLNKILLSYVILTDIITKFSNPANP